MTIVLILLALAALRFLLIAVGVVALIHPVRACPACFRETLPICQRWLERFAPRFEWRWCPSCRWQGPSRRARRSTAV